MSRASAIITTMLCMATPAMADTADALRELDQVFSGYFRWFGSMYERSSGGAYYSFPSRAQPHVYPAQIESTSKYSNVIDWSELVPAAPQGQRDAMVEFTKSRQMGDPAHRYFGYFLDPSYDVLDPSNNGATVTERHSGRALNFATGLLDLFGAKPTYPLPGSGTGGAPPPHLASGQAFKDWIDTLNWDRSWTPGNTILGQTTLINGLQPALREEILNTAWEHFPTYQDPATGLWGNLSSSENTKPYIALNGGHKIAAFYKAFSRPIPHADALLATALREVSGNEVTNLLYTYNSSQLVFNLQDSLSTPMTEQARAGFIEKQAANLALFRQADGGFAGTTASTTPASQYGPAAPIPYSNTDVGGLALKARDTLNKLANGKVVPLSWASDDRIFAMSGGIGKELAFFDFEGKSLIPRTDPLASASALSAGGTDSRVGFESENGPINSSQITHSGFNDRDSYYEFTFAPKGRALQLFFLAIWARNGSDSENETVVLKYSTDGGESFLEAGRTTIPGSDSGLKERAFPLLIIDSLQDLSAPVVFRLYGWDFAKSGRSFRLDGIQVFGREKRGGSPR